MTIPRLDQAFAMTPREHFLPDDITDLSEYDQALPIGFGQTNSQPSTVYNMLSWLQPETGNTVLDVGSGSGWSSALLGRLVGNTGHVVATELVPELKQFGQENCAKLGLSNIKFHTATHEVGFPKKAPYDRILVSASADNLPNELINQLGKNGILVIPIKNSIWVIEKHGKTLDKTEHPGYVFVPLVLNSHQHTD